MKKTILSIIAMLVLVTMLAVPALAADGTVTVSDATGASGEVVYVTVSLAGFENANAMGVEYTGVPELVNEASEWKLEGLKDIGTEKKNVCVWGATGDPVAVNGEVLKLALRLPAYDGTKSYAVEVKVTLKSNTTLLGEVTKSGTITVHNPAQSVTLDKATLALDLSGTKSAALTATVNPAYSSDTVVWTSSDAAVVSVANGMVTALRPGTATVTATAGTKSASCAVTVSCAHANAVKTDPKAATCKETGNNAYWTCGDCQQVLKADKATVTTVAAETLATIAHKGGTATCTQQAVCTMCSQPYGEKAAHSFSNKWTSDADQHWRICTVCNTEKGSVAAHTFEWKIDAVATEKATGLKHEACTSCKLERNKGTVIPKLPHAPAKAAGRPATCTQAGVAEHYFCANCGSFYASENGTIGKAIKKEETAIAALGHSFGTEWLSDETGHWHVCSVCQEKSAVEAHTAEVVDAVEATQEVEGYTGDQVCTACKTVVAKGEVIPVVVPETTVAPTEAPAQTDAQRSDPTAIIVLVVVAVAAAAGLVIILVKKRK